MTKTTTDADRLMAEGVTIPTALGDMQLRYGFRALRTLEEKYGGLEQVQTAMEGVAGKGAAFGPLLDIIVPGLLHTGHSEDELVDALIPRELGTYVDAMVEAMRQAFPDAPASAEGKAPAPAKQSAKRARPARPRGQSGTTSQPAATGAPTPSSGT